MTQGSTWPQVQLQAGESVLLQERASWSRHGIARGGTLVITEDRVVFQPNSMETSLGLSHAVWKQAEIKKVDVTT